MAVEVYTNVFDIPADKPPPWEGDDSLLAQSNGKKLSQSAAKDIHAVMMDFSATRLEMRKDIPTKRVVILSRTLELDKPVMKGLDVAGYQRALKRAGLRTSKVSREFGAGTKKETIALQRALGFDKENRDGAYGAKTHVAFTKAFPNAYDAYAAQLLSLAPHPEPKKQVEQIMVGAAFALYNYDQQTMRMHYTQTGLRMWIVRNMRKPPFQSVDIYEDCSSSSTGLFWIGGAPDPNGLKFNGQGYTGTLCEHGKQVSSMGACRLAFYGSGPPYHHVTFGLGGNRTWSHGWEGGPNIYDTPRYRSDLHEIREYPLV